MPAARPRTLILTLGLAILATTTSAQQTDRHAITRSVATSSPEVPLTWAEADVVSTNSTQYGGGGVVWRRDQLGLPPGTEVDAFSDATDIFPLDGPAVATPPVLCGYVFTEFSVDPLSQGAPGSAIENEVQDDGAASDTFGVHHRFSGTFRHHTSDHLDLSPLPHESDIDALVWNEVRRFPVYFSVDPASAAQLGVSPADVLKSPSPGAWEVHREAAQLGLRDSDDIDALSIDPNVDPAGMAFVVSLSRGSPTVSAGGAWPGVGPGGLLVSDATGLRPWALPGDLDLDLLSDNVNAVRITDPVAPSALDCAHTDPDSGFPAEILRLDGTAGNIRHIVELPSGSDFELSITPLEPKAPVAVFLYAGRPCLGEELVLAGGTLSFTPDLPAVIIFGAAAIPVNLGNVVGDVTLQGLTRDTADGPLYTTNAVTLRLY